VKSIPELVAAYFVPELDVLLGVEVGMQFPVEFINDSSLPKTQIVTDLFASEKGVSIELDTGYEMFIPASRVSFLVFKGRNAHPVEKTVKPLSPVSSVDYCC